MPTFSPVIELVPELQVARLDLVQLFGRSAPLHVDLGCGDGSFLCEMAQQFPKRNFLGIDRLTKRVEKVRRKAEKIENVRVLRADTLFAVRYLLPKNSVETFYLLFPDPWPKRRHQFRRIFTRDFLEAIAVALEKHGILRVATDQLDYFHQIELLSRAVAGCRSSGNQVRKEISRAGRPDLSADASKDFAGQISSRAPFLV